LRKNRVAVLLATWAL